MSQAEAYLQSKGIAFSSSGSEARIAECPFCHGRDDLSVNISGDAGDGLFLCFKCSRKGNLITLAKAYGDDPSNLPAVESANLKPVVNSTGKRKSLPSMEQLTRLYNDLVLFTDEGPALIDWLTKTRGISHEVIRHQRLGLMRRCWFHSDKPNRSYQRYVYHDALVIPYIQSDQCVYVKYRTFGEIKLFRNSGGPCPLYNVDCLRSAKGQDLLLCEGEMDVLAALSNGFDFAIGVPGASFTKPALIEQVVASHARRFILAMDNDVPGDECAARWSRYLPRTQTLRLKLPTGCKDINDFLLQNVGG